MSTEIGNPFLLPSPERTSLLQVGFEPSQKLNDALHRFLIPRVHNRDFSFKTMYGRRVPYSASDNNGIRYDREIAQELHRDRRALSAFQLAPIAIGAAAIEESREGDVRIRLELDPSREQRERLVGTFVLRELREKMLSAGEPLQAYIRFSHYILRAPDEIAKAAYMLQHDLGMHLKDTRMRQQPSALNVRRPHITERTGDIHCV